MKIYSIFATRWLQGLATYVVYVYVDLKYFDAVFSKIDFSNALLMNYSQTEYTCKLYQT